MSYTEVDGVIVNNLTLEQYRALREAENINTNECYCITDIDTVLDEIASSTGGGSSICMAKLTSNKTVQNGNIKLPLALSASSGSDLTVSSNGIKCGKAGTVKVNAFLSLDFGAMTVPYVTIKKNSTNIAKVILDECDPYISFSDILINVSAGDIIYLYVECLQDRVIAQYANNGTRLTVEYV